MSAAPAISTDLAVHLHGRPLGEAPAMLLLHGLTDSGTTWPDAVRHWSDRYAVVSYDARGHGRSPRFTPEHLDGWPGDVMVEDALAILGQLDRPVVVGHSLGGAVALCVGARRPDLVRALVCEDPAPLGPDEQHPSGRGQEFLVGVRESLAAPDDEALLGVRRAKHPLWPESELLPTGYAEQQVDLEYLGRGSYKPSTPWTDLLPALRVPTLVVSGDPDGAVCVDGRMEAGIEQAGAQVTLVRIEGAGHCVRRDRPEAFYHAVDGWLQGL